MSMDDLAVNAAVSRPTATNTSLTRSGSSRRLWAPQPATLMILCVWWTNPWLEKTSLESGLIVLARRFMSTMMHLRILQLRRLVMANAKRFPDVGRSWCEQGFERVLATLAISFEDLAHRKLLYVSDPLLAANHFVEMLLWTPISKAMFTGDHSSSPEGLERYAVAAVRTFLAGYGTTRYRHVGRQSHTRQPCD